MKNTRPAIVFAAIAVILFNGPAVLACPFCSVESQTLSEETAAADAVVLARQIAEAKPIEATDDPNSGTAKFEVIEVLRGKEVVGDAKQIDVVHFGEFDRERVYLVMGLGAETPDWTTPLPLSKAADEYVRKLATLPPSGAERLAFFQEYLEHEDPLLAQDAYDEFARASYEDVIALAPQMHHDRLVNWISDLEISPSRRRLYFTMLGTCGSKDDLPLLESLIVSNFDAVEPQLKQSLYSGLALGGPLSLPVWLDVVEQQERQKKLGLDALVACYLTLRGGDGLDLIDERFLKDPKTDYTQVYSTIMALRFHGDQETGVLPKERLLKSMRLLLDNPDFADQVVLDLSRWEDWSVMERLVEMFKASKDKAYIRQPVVTYLTVAGDQPGDVGLRAQSRAYRIGRTRSNHREAGPQPDGIWSTEPSARRRRRRRCNIRSVWPSALSPQLSAQRRIGFRGVGRRRCNRPGRHRRSDCLRGARGRSCRGGGQRRGKRTCGRKSCR
jgi:hypothetical protein